VLLLPMLLLLLLPRLRLTAAAASELVRAIRCAT
jgi:hypothetical protein